MMKRAIQMLLLAGFCVTTTQAELVGYWTFDSDNCNDSSGNEYDGTMNGGSYSTDVSTELGSGKSIDLSAGDHYVIIDSIAFGAATDPFDLEQSITVSFWSKGWPSTWNPFVSKSGESSGGGWQARKKDTTTHVAWTTKGTTGGATNGDLEGQTSDASTAGWHHIAVTYNGYRKRIYIDGVLDRVNSATGSISASDRRVVFGARETTEGAIGNYSRGMLDNIAIYSDALSEGQIKVLAGGGDPITILNVVKPIGYWTFDDNITDASGLGRNGTLTGGCYSNDVPSALSGKSLDLRGGDHYALIDSVSRDDSADPFSLGKNITISAWIKGWPSDWCAFVAKHGESTYGWQLRKHSTSSHIGWTTRGPTSVDFEGATSDAANGNWHHIACTYDGAHKTIYVDGVIDKWIAATGGMNSCYERVIFGADNPGGTPAGFAKVQLDDIAIFGQTLMIPQIYALSQGTSANDLPNSPDSAYCNAIQFDINTAGGKYMGTASPGHISDFNSNEKWWNSVNGDDSHLWWANGASASDISIDFGRTDNNAGGANINWSAALTLYNHTALSGFYDTDLMRDWLYSKDNNDLGVRVRGLPAGLYKVFALVREGNATDRTYDVFIGTNIENSGDSPAVKKSITATSATTWVDGKNYVSTPLYVNSETDYITVIVDPTSAAYASLEGLQIIKLAQGTMIIIQ